jgi:hypothetical protein
MGVRANGGNGYISRGRVPRRSPMKRIVVVAALVAAAFGHWSAKNTFGC